MVQRLPDVQHFIYPLTSGSGYSFGGGADISPENYWRDALKGKIDEWGLATGYRVIEPGDWVWAYFGGAVRRMCGVGTVHSPVAWRDDWQRHSVFIKWDPALTRRMQAQPIRYSDYRQQVQGASVRANAGTLRVLRRWLGQQGAAAHAHGKKVKFAERTVRQRLGQAEFRAEVLRAYRGACAITGCREASVLQAGHIRPVGSGGKHSIENAVLLRADLHNLFDLGLLTVGPGFKVVVTPEVRDPRYRALAAKTIALPASVARSKIAAAYTEHRTFHGS
jgi:hypothetical protein